MNTFRSIPRRSLKHFFILALSTAATAHWLATPVVAQPAATAPAATTTAPVIPGSRGIGPGGLNREQQNAAITMDMAVAALNQAVAVARTNLIQATFAEKPDEALLKTSVAAVAKAELALAGARADEFLKMQATELKLNPQQVNTIIRNSAQFGRAGGVAGGSTVTRRPGFLADRAALLSQGGPQLVFLGDSITDFWRTTGRTVFTNTFAKYHTYDIGISGIRTQDVANQIDLGDLDGTNPKAAMLMIGTNNLQGDSDENIAAGIGDIVGRLRKKLPNTKILLLAIFPRAVSATDPLRARIKNINGLISKLEDGRAVKYLDIGAKFLTGDGTLTAEIMPDALHPSAAGYQIWADAVTPTLEEMLR